MSSSTGTRRQEALVYRASSRSLPRKTVVAPPLLFRGAGTYKGGQNMLKRDSKGFTLIELLIVVAIIGIIAAIAIPNLLNAIDRGKQKRTMADIRSIGTAVESYAVDNNKYPMSWSNATAATMATSVAPIYIKTVPTNDGWNNAWHADSNATGTTYTLQSYAK